MVNKFKSTTIGGSLSIINLNSDLAHFSCAGNVDISGNLTISGTTTGITKDMIGLNNVDNTSDIDKPISNATQLELDNRYTKAESDALFSATTDLTPINNSITNLTNDINNLNTNLNTNYYTKTDSDNRYASLMDFNLLDAEVSNISNDVNNLSNNLNNNYYSKTYIDSNYLTLVNILKAVYPVGSIYINYDNTNNPNTIFGVTVGTWTQITGRFLRANTTGGGTGGSETINLSHNHQWYNHGTAGSSNTIDTTNTSATGSSFTIAGGTSNITSNELTSSYWTDNKLSSTQSILPPYVDVLMWRRTA